MLTFLSTKLSVAFYTLHLFSITANVVTIPECVFTDCIPARANN